MKNKNIHLKEDRILLCLVEENDLTEETRKHLEECPVCQEKRTSLLAELQIVGEMADEFTPAPKKKPDLPVEQPGRQRFRLPILGTGFATALLVAILVSMHLFSNSSSQLQTDLTLEREVRMGLFEEILVESALSEQYLDMTPSSYSFLDDEFLEFVVPLEEPSGSSQGFLYLTAKA